MKNLKNLQLYEYYGPRGEHADLEERIELLQEAQGKLSEGIALIEQALKGTTHQRHAETYLIGHLNNWIDSGNRFDMGIQQYIDKLEEENELESEDGEDEEDLDLSGYTDIRKEEDEEEE